MIGYVKKLYKTELNTFIKENLPVNDSASRIYRGGWYWDNFQKHFSDISQKDYDYNIFDDHTWADSRIKSFWKMVEHLESEGQKIICYAIYDISCIVGCEGHKYIMPLDFFEIEELKDYSAIPMSELKLLGGTADNANLPANIDNISRDSLNNDKNELENKAEQLKQQYDDVKNAKTTELAKIQAEIDRMQTELRKKQENLMAQLDEKQAELDEQMQILNNQLFMLDSQIYSIRCYLGEVIDFKPILNGNKADKEVPLIIYQKIRFLDEELGKYLGMYNIPITEENGGTLIEILKNREDLRELFAPNDKCITILKASRTGTVKAPSSNVSNLLRDYEEYHGKQIAVLVRNGENIYIGWTDAEKVSISDENVFFIPKSDSFRGADEDVIETKSSKTDMVSRMFLMSLVQGLKDNSELINLPQNTSVFKPDNKYIVFSAAEGWLKDNTYGTYEDILNKSKDIPLKEGDYIFTAMNIGRDDGLDYKSKYESYNNNRGIGCYNRTHDSHIPGLKALPINKVLYDAVIEYTYEKYEAVIDGDKECPFEYNAYYKITDNFIGIDIFTDTVDFESWKEICKNGENNAEYLIKRKNDSIYDYLYYRNKSNYRYKNNINSCVETNGTDYHTRKIIDAKIIKNIPHYFVATKGSNWWSGNSYSVNMEIYEKEYHSLAYLCPTWIKYVIKTGNIGNIYLCGAQMTYSDLLRDLNGILEHLNKVQEIEREYLIKAGLEDWISNTPNWDVIVTEWRIANKKRRLTETNARTFAKYISSK